MSRKDAEIRISENAVFVDPDKLPDDDGRSEYTVYIPDDLTDYFRPSQPVTLAQENRFDHTGKEPYPGYAEELWEWQRRWELVNDAQAKADGHPIFRLPSVHDALTGNLSDEDKALLETYRRQRDAAASGSSDTDMDNPDTDQEDRRS